MRIGLGGPEDPTHLMSHDWHTNDQGTPWHQNHVRSGYVGIGPWAVDVRRAGRYEVTLYRWPPHLGRAMGMLGAEVTLGEVGALQKLDPEASAARFELVLPAGPAMLLTKLVREDGKEHGAYHATVRFLGE